MSKTFKIFTCGSSFDAYEDKDWRNKFERMLHQSTDKDVTFVHPPYYYEYLDNTELLESANAHLKWETNHILNSDVIVINTDRIADSAQCEIELAIELGFILGANRTGRNITVVGFGEKEIEHPWIQSCFSHFEKTMEDTVDYIVNLVLI